MKIKSRIRLLKSAAIIVGILVPAAANASVQASENSAPEGPQTGEPSGAATAAASAAPASPDIVVTGSRIARPDLQTSSPVSVMGQQEIRLRQPNTAEELLRDLPSVRPSLGPAVNNGSDGSAVVDLRGLNQSGSLNSQRTLVLLDGRRLVPFGLDGFSDTNTVPLGLVDRVDVVTGGASTVYGADAVAGVVNFVLRRDFSGADLRAQYRLTEAGDGAQLRADLVLGANFDDGRGNAVLAIGYQKRDPILMTDRSVSRMPISSANGLFSGSTNSVPTIFTSPGNAALGLANNGFGAAFDPATGALRAGVREDTLNTSIGTYLETPLDSINVYSAAHYQIAPSIEIYASGMFARNQVRVQLAPSGTFASTYKLPLNNAYLPTPARNQLCTALGITPAACSTAAAVQGGPGTPGYIEASVIAQRRFVEYGPRGNDFESTLLQIQAGFRGNITESLHYDLSAQYGETNQNQSREHWGSFTRVQQALRSFRNAAGTPVCVDASNGCVPINLFGPAGSITQPMIDFFALDARIRRVVTQTVVTGALSGDLFNLTSPLAHSPIGFALGGEYRRISARSLPDAPSQVQGEVLGTGARTPPDSGKYDVREAFGEVIVPLIEDGFIYSASLEGGIRLSDYSTTGSSTTWKAGGSISPIRGFRFRGMYQRAVRSPNILELFQSPVQTLSNLAVDPCAGAAPTASRALCEATGAPGGTYGSIPQPSASQINATTSGNPNLGVERASTITLGAALTPGFVPNFSLTVDYFRIRLSDAITAPGQGDIINGCYSSALNPSQTPNGFCQLIQRNPLNGSLNGAGETPGVILGGSNLGRIETAGVDFGANYRFGLGLLGGRPATVNLGLNGTWLSYYHFQATPNSINRDCTGYYSPDCQNPRPQWKWSGRLTFSRDPIDISLLWTHLSGVRLEPFLATAQLPLSTPQPGGPNPANILGAFQRIPAYDYIDLVLRFRLSEQVEFTASVQNLFEKRPPLLGSGVGGTLFNNGNTFPTVYDAVGRSFTFGAHVRF